MEKNAERMTAMRDRLIAGLDEVTSGNICINGTPLKEVKRKKTSEQNALSLRDASAAAKIGFKPFDVSRAGLCDRKVQPCYDTSYE